MNEPTFPPNVWAYVARAANNDFMRADAAAILDARGGFSALFSIRPPRKEIHVSDAGVCALELKARLAGECADFDPQTRIFKLDDGTLHGAHWAALFKVGFEAEHPGYSVLLEVPVQLDGGTEYSHADIVVRQDDSLEAMWVGDFKRTAYAGKDGPSEAQRLQVTQYAEILGAPHASLITLETAGRKEPVQTDLVVREWHSKLASERVRLATALGPAPQCDGGTYGGKYCKRVDCPRAMEKSA